jgi:folate-dependent phosphoribosylglycinamide formyltransferase PurN
MAQNKDKSQEAMKIIILTGNEPRHNYFRVMVASDPRIEVLASYCEVSEMEDVKHSGSRMGNSLLEQMHLVARKKSELEFFGEAVKSLGDESNPKKIQRGQINDKGIVGEIEKSDANLLVCYGSSLIKSSLIKTYKRRFLNVHLGLSPYYRGSGTNIWPLINGEPEMVGATFMHLDEGIDTGEIIHQIRADFFVGDSPHSIGNRLIKKMTSTCCEVISSFDQLLTQVQPAFRGKLYSVKDFNSEACSKLYANFDSGMIANYLENSERISLPVIIENRGL